MIKYVDLGVRPGGSYVMEIPLADGKYVGYGTFREATPRNWYSQCDQSGDSGVSSHAQHGTADERFQPLWGSVDDAGGRQ